MEREKSGFTLLEVILVVAIATLLFMSVTLGIGGRIATGRYETASNEVADFVRDTFAETLNVENQRIGVEGAREYCTLYGAARYSALPSSDIYKKVEGNKIVLDTKENDKSLNSIPENNVYPGRTACAIYGKILFFGATDNKVHIFDIVGDTVTADRATADKKSDIERLQEATPLEQLEYVRADYLAAVPRNNSNNLTGISTDCTVQPAAGYTTYEPNWGALFKTANFGVAGRGKNADFVGFIMIFRAPISGDVHTLFYEQSVSDPWDFSSLVGETAPGGCGKMTMTDYKNRAASDFYAPLELLRKYQTDQAALPEDERDKNTGFCIGSDDFYVSMTNIRKYVEIIGDAQNASAIKLDESGGNPCQK